MERLCKTGAETIGRDLLTTKISSIMMNYDKALSLYRNDKTLQLLRAEHFPLLVSFFVLIRHKNTMELQMPLMETDDIFKPVFPMGRPLFTPPARVFFPETSVGEGVAQGDASALFDQFYVDMQELKQNVAVMLRSRSQVTLSELLQHFPATRGVSEILGYMQIATSDKKHYLDQEQRQALDVENVDSGETYRLEGPLIIFNK